VLALTGDAARPAALAQDATSCADPDDGRQWNVPRAAAASTSDSTWKWRSLHAAFAAGPGPGRIVTTRTSPPHQPRAPAAPAHLLYTPLLI
jgi:hypothetical protein